MPWPRFKFVQQFSISYHLSLRRSPLCRCVYGRERKTDCKKENNSFIRFASWQRLAADDKARVRAKVRCTGDQSSLSRGGCVRAALSHCCNFWARLFFLPISPAIAHRSRGDRCGRFSLRVNKRSLKNIFCAKLSVSIIFHSNAIMRTFSGQKLESITYANLCSNKDSNRLAFYRLAVRQGSFASVKSRSFTFIACPYRISVKCICRGDFAAIEWKASGLENGD